MLKWYKELYIGKHAEKRINRIQNRIDRGKRLPRIWLISLAANGRDQLDIFDARNLYQPAFRARCPMIVGVAADYGEALELVIRMADDVYRSRGDGNIRAWVEGREGYPQRL